MPDPHHEKDTVARPGGARRTTEATGRQPAAPREGAGQPGPGASQGLSEGCVTAARVSPAASPSPPSLGGLLGAVFPSEAEVAESTRRFDPDSAGRFIITSTPGAITLKRTGGRLAHTIRPIDHTPGEVTGRRGSQVPTTRFHPRAMTRMASRLATLDYRPLFSDPRRQVVMVTLTWPGDPTTWTSASQAKTQFRRFYGRLRRALGPPLLGVWAWEFQRRGAPHVHLLVALPALIGSDSRRTWLSRAWFECVGSGDERHLRAGTGIDWGESTRFVSPVSVAVYFARHGGAKAYQKRPPEFWVRQGESYRWWGYWGLRPLTIQVRIDDRVAVEVKRLMRAHYRSKHSRRSVARPVRRVVLAPDSETGELVAVRDERGGRVTVPVMRQSIHRDRTGVAVIDARGQCVLILDEVGAPVLVPYYRRVHRRPRLRWLQNAAGGTYLASKAPQLLDRFAEAATYAAVCKFEGDQSDD